MGGVPAPAAATASLDVQARQMELGTASNGAISGGPRPRKLASPSDEEQLRYAS